MVIASSPVRIRPFRGYRYRIGTARDLSRVVAPPYDQISHETQERLYAMSPENIVRVTYAKDEPGADPYRRARETLDRWVAAGGRGPGAPPGVYPPRPTDGAVIARVQALMADRSVIIADGHHRYETAVEYARRYPGTDTKLMAFFTLEAPGLTIFPNHRLVHHVERFSLDALVAAARRWFDVTPLADPVGFTPTNRSIGVVAGRDAVVCTLRDEAFETVPWPPGTSRAWR